MFHNRQPCPSGEIGRHIGLKIRRFVNNGRTGSIPVSGTKICNHIVRDVLFEACK